MEAEPKTRVATRLEVPPRVLDPECAPFQEDVCRLGQPCGVGEHVLDQELDVRCCAGFGELRRHGMRAQEGRRSAGIADHAELRELGVMVEAVAGFRLERRRPGAEHPGDVALERHAQPLVAGLARRADRREDPAAGRVELLVRRPAGAERELLHAIAGEARMRVAVDEPGDGGHSAPVELLDLSR